MEIWKDAVGLESLIEISNLGNVRGKNRYCPVNRKGKDFFQYIKGKTYKLCKTKTGYLEIAIQHNACRKKYRVHRLVGMAFVDGFEPHLSINHINGIKTDNRAENLEWVTLSINTHKQWKDGLVNLRGENHPSKKLSAKQVIYIRKLISKGISPNTLAIIAGVNPTLIYLIRDGKRWSSIPDNKEI